MSTVVNLEKGAKVDLTKAAPGMAVLMLGLGWNPNESKNLSGAAFDLDAFGIVLKEGKVLNGNVGSLLYFGSPKTGNPANEKETAILDKALVYTGDNLTGEGEGDDERILVEFAKLPADATEIVLGMNIYEAGSRKQNMGMVDGAFIRAADAATENTDICKYDLSEDFSTATGAIAGKLYKKDGEWRFQALGTAVAGSIADIFNTYL